MNTKNIFRYGGVLLTAAALMLTSCRQEESPSIDDYFLNYNIEHVDPVDGISVGAVYYNLSLDETRYNCIIGEYDQTAEPVRLCPHVRPVLGNYRYDLNSEATIDLFQTHIDWAQEAGIDYFIMPNIGYDATAQFHLNASNLKFYNFMEGLIAPSMDRINWGSLRFCASVNLQNIVSGLSKTKCIEDDQASHDKLIEYFQGLAERFFTGDELYYRIDDKPVIVLWQAQYLWCQDAKAVYDEVRQAIRDVAGCEVYLIARQSSWSPPARWHNFFLLGGVDAVYMDNMYNQSDNARVALYPQMINENWKYNREYDLQNYNVDFIPTVAPSYNAWVASQGTGNYNIPLIFKDETTFSTLCNVAKMNLGNSKQVILDSFNNWQFDTAIEPTDPYYGNGYGMRYIEMTKEAFKK